MGASMAGGAIGKGWSRGRQYSAGGQGQGKEVAGRVDQGGGKGRWGEMAAGVESCSSLVRCTSGIRNSES